MRLEEGGEAVGDKKNDEGGDENASSDSEKSKTDSHF